MTGIYGVYPDRIVDEIRSVKEVKSIFHEGYDPRLNWLFLSTQGNHGTYLTLDDIEEIIAGTSTKAGPVNGKFWITVCIVMPRLSNLLYGEILVGPNDIDFLRDIVRNTLEAIPMTQQGNI